MYLCMCEYVRMYVCTYLCVYMYTHIHTYMFSIDVYLSVNRDVLKRWLLSSHLQSCNQVLVTCMAACHSYHVCCFH